MYNTLRFNSLNIPDDITALSKIIKHILAIPNTGAKWYYVCIYNCTIICIKLNFNRNSLSNAFLLSTVVFKFKIVIGTWINVYLSEVGTINT